MILLTLKIVVNRYPGYLLQGPGPSLLSVLNKWENLLVSYGKLIQALIIELINGIRKPWLMDELKMRQEQF